MTRTPSRRRAVRSMSRTRSLMPTPQSMVRRGATAVGRVAGRGLLNFARRSNPYVSGALTAYPYIKRAVKFARTNMTRRVRRGKKTGAAFSKSAGFFTEFGPRKGSAMEQYLERGVVYNSENGGIINNNVGGSFKDVIYVGHSTMPKQRVLEVAFAGLLKHLFKKAGIKIKNWSDAVLYGANIPARLELLYKDSDAATFSTFAATIPIGQTFQQTVAKFVDWYNAFSGATVPASFLTLTYYHDIGTIGSSRLIAYEIDLSSTKVHLESVSYLKIQNRTLNQDGVSKDADDVDNVPIYGRSFTVNGNGSMFRDYNMPVAATSAPQLRTDPFFGILNYNLTADIDAGSTMWQEVPVKTQIVGVKSYGPAHLDPGQVKTSKLTFKTIISFPKLMLMIRLKAPVGGATVNPPNTNATPFFLGNTRIFAFEKMIKAVATTTANQVQLAYEVNTDIGCFVQTYQNYQTAKQTQSSLGAIVP